MTDSIRAYQAIRQDYLCGGFGDGLKMLFGDLLTLAETQGLDSDDVAQIFDEALAAFDPVEQCDSLTYSGWDRIHDDNKSEGRPIGNQWTSEGVDYSTGLKVHI